MFYRKNFAFLHVIGVLLVQVLYVSSTALQGAIVKDSFHPRQDWSAVDRGDTVASIIDTLKGSGFKIGAATAEYQISGADILPDSNMARGESDGWWHPSGIACDGWNRCIEDIALLKEIGCSTYRFSIDWSSIEPREGVFDHTALQHYRDFCFALVREGIEPLVTLHHFVIPQWFQDKGGFELLENCFYLRRFCKLVYYNLGDLVTQWCTINEPGIYMLQSYIRGVFPPFKSLPFVKERWTPATKSSTKNLKLAGQVVLNLLLTHVDIYHDLHNAFEEEYTKKPHTHYQKPSIGFAHQYLVFEPFHGAWYDPRGMIERQITSLLTHWVNTSIMTFFATGTFAFPGASSLKHECPQACRTLDWVGLNYYSRVFNNLVDGMQPGYYPGDIRTDMPYGVYAEGLYTAIEDMSRLNVPIYITENGIADQGDTVREIWILRHFDIIAQAIRNGYDLRGYYYWSLMDNYEWDMGLKEKFGLYKVNFSSESLERILRKGAYMFGYIAHGVQGTTFVIPPSSPETSR